MLCLEPGGWEISWYHKWKRSAPLEKIATLTGGLWHYTLARSLLSPNSTLPRLYVPKSPSFSATLTRSQETPGWCCQANPCKRQGKYGGRMPAAGSGHFWFFLKNPPKVTQVALGISINSMVQTIEFLAVPKATLGKFGGGGVEKWCHSWCHTGVTDFGQWEQGEGMLTQTRSIF